MSNMLRDIPRLLVFRQPQLKVRKWDYREKKWKSMFWNEVFIIHYSLPKSVEKILMANFCRHQVYLLWQIRQQLQYAVAKVRGLQEPYLEPIQKSLMELCQQIMVNDIYLLTFFAETPHHKRSTVFQKRLCCL